MPETGHGMSDYRAPSYLERYARPAEDIRKADNYLMGRLKEYKTAGETLLRSQTAYRDFDIALDILGENRVPQSLKGMSTVSVNRCRREYREMVAAISNLRPTENCISTNPDMESTVHKLNQRCKLWWNATFADRQYRRAAQWVFGTGTAYISPWWDNNFYGYGSGEIALKVYGPMSVLPVMMTEDFDIQKAYAVTFVEELPIHLVIAAFPEFQDRLISTRKVPGWMARAVERAKQKATDLWGVLNSPMEPTSVDMPTLDVYYTYIMDMETNNTGRRIAQGKPGTSWAYEVPYIGEEYDSGLKDQQGRPLNAVATSEDCLLFPLRRLSIWTDTVVLQDGTSPYLHGKVPGVQLRFDDNPWEFLGYPIIHDTWRIQRSRNRLIRTMENSFHVRMSPPLQWDENMISEAAVARINTQQPGQRIKVNAMLGDAIKPLLDPKHWDVPGWGVEFVKFLGEEQSYLSLTKDLTALAKAKQVPSADSIEKLMEMAGQVPQDIARGGEKAICELAALWFPLEIQFSSVRNMLKVLGPKGITKEGIDYRPGSLIPSHLPGEDVSKPSRFQDWQRLRWTVEQMSFQVEPYSQAQLSKIGRALTLLQFLKAGMPVDPWMIAKAANIDIGPEPEGTDNGMQRFVAFQMMKAELAKELAALQQGGEPPQQGDGRGRPPTNKQPPQVKQKEGGTRSTVTTAR